MYEELKQLINNSKNILVISHKKPDGDTIGANCGMSLALKNLGKEVQSCCIDKIPEKLQFLPYTKYFKTDISFQNVDLIIAIDCGAFYMSGYHEKIPDIWNKGMPVVNIDHHPSNDSFGKINIIENKSASTTIIIYKIFTALNIKITPEMATSLLTGIYTDTGSFMHSNTNKEVYEIASDLIKMGGNFNLIIKSIFKNTSISTLKLWGKALLNAKLNEEGVIMTALTNEDFIECESNPEELSGVIDLINSVPNTKFSVLLNEDKRGNVKGSFRTNRETVNVSEIAQIFGGGGHKKAAGFTIPGKLEKEVRWKIIPDVKNK
jgi:bifunctional oligoribonuclease and PAP phosphatase NrnA